MESHLRLFFLSGIIMTTLVATGCNSGGFSGDSKKVETVEKKEEPQKKPAKNPQKQETLGSEKESEEVEKPTVQPNPQPPVDNTVDDDIVTTTTPPVHPQPQPQPQPQPLPPPAPPVVIPPTDTEVGNLRFKAVPFVNMEHESHATEPGSWAILKSSSGAVIAAGPMTVYAACRGESIESMAYPVVRLNVGLKFVSSQIETGQLSGQQQGSLSICIINGSAGDSMSCQQQSRGNDQARPAFWYDRPVSFTVAANAQISIDNRAGYTEGGMGLQGSGENIAGGLSFAHPLQAPVCGSSARGYADYNSPLVIDTNRNGKLDLSNVWQEKNPVRFDINGDNNKVRTGWIDGDGLLVLDVNGDGLIDSGRELFGENSHSVDGQQKTHFTRFANGFQALAQYDRNLDGRIDVKDEVFNKLKVWTDKNKNGRSDAGELQSLTELKISSLSLAYTKTGSKFKYFMVGMNEVRLMSSVNFEDGTSAQMADVWFASRSDETAAITGGQKP